MLYNPSLCLINLIVGNLIAYLIITRGIKREFRLTDFFRSNLNMLLFFILAPAFADFNLFQKYLWFAVFMAVVNTIIDFCI